MARQEDTQGTLDVSRDAASPGEAEVRNDEPHATRVVVWDTPPAVERGTRFAVRLGVSCSAKCRTAGWTVEVHDHDGSKRATTTLGDNPWPGTDALYHAEVALVAPDTEGLYTWQAAAQTGDTAVVHTAGSASFRVRIVSAPACLVTVVAADAESRAPVEGARVVAHPYRAVTDEHGVAQLRVPAGEYRLFVSGQGYVPFRFDGEVKADTTMRAELVQDVELSDTDIWS
ncbi:MAG: carboxypeptidase-like regulatory domain-containing protein [Acidobacteria bacterium]|nr:carboxypeptidase-like regulatory domain-containing protein [Acidobacteriota bacterium]